MELQREDGRRRRLDERGTAMKYIELEKAIGAVEGAFKFEVERAENYRDIAVETLKLLPTVEVVRCKECVMWDGSFTLNGQKKCLNMTFCTCDFSAIQENDVRNDDSEVHHARKHFIFCGSGKECGGLHRRSVKGGELMRYIDADKAKNGIMKFVNEYGEIVGMFVNDFNILLERCAVDVEEVKHGRWEELMEHRGAGGILGGKDICVGYACSECGEQFDIMTYYCPYCGASMVNEDE